MDERTRQISPRVVPAGATLTPRAISLLEALAAHWGVTPVDAAVSMGIVSDVTRSRAYAALQGRAYVTEKDAGAHLDARQAIAAARHRIILAPDHAGSAAAVIPAPSPRPHPAANYTNIAFTAPSAFDAALRKFWPAIVEDVTNRLSFERPRFSAAYRRIAPQLVWFAMAVLIAMLGVLPWYVWPALVGNVILCVAFLALAILRILAIPAPSYGTPPERPTADLPAYTVLVPLYQEASVVADLVEDLSTLDYPRPKLDIRLLIEDDDEETLDALRSLTLSPVFTVVLIPPVGPRTKPKALNVGMIGAWGDLVTIYDAEDVPDRDQLRRAAAHFAAVDETVGCLQARLRIDNAASGVLPGFFAIEYEALFRRFLPALQRLGLPIPLGGTSNHMRREALDKIGGWDPYNVTEDADLGFRLLRYGYRVETLDSDTWEEAPTGLRAWFFQRARWYKGWLQTWIVHMRHPTVLLRETGWRGFLGLQLLMGGMFLSAIAHPMLLLASVFWALGITESPIGNSTMATINLWSIVLGHGAMMTLCWLACADGPQQRRRFLLVPWLPLYMVLHTFAALRSIGDYLTAPFHWSKTRHGGTHRETLRKI